MKLTPDENREFFIIIITKRYIYGWWIFK